MHMLSIVRSLIPFVFTFSCDNVFSQIPFKAKYQSFLYKEAVDYVRPAKEGIYDTIYAGYTVIGLGVKGACIVAAYNNNIGYFPQSRIDIKQDQINKLRFLQFDTSAALVASQKAWQMDNNEAESRKAEEIKRLIDAEVQRVTDSISIVQKNIADSIAASRVFKRFLKNGLGILDFGFPTGDYSAGFRISLTNYSPKTVKYIWATVSFYNPVNDLIATKTVQMVGPLKQYEQGDYNFENVVFTKIMDSGKIRTIKVQYIDGSIKTFTGPTLSNILL